MHYLTVLLILSINLANASELEFELSPQSSISIGGGYDTDENKNYNMYLDLEFSNYHHLGFGYFKNESSLDDSSTDNYSLSVATSAYETTSLDANFNYIKLADTMASYSFSSGINLNLENWHFLLTPKLNAITFYLDSDRQNKFDIYAKGAKISASYYGFDQYYFSASYFKNDFSEKPIFLRPAVFDSLASSTVTKIRIITRISELTSSLEEQHLALHIGRYFNWGNLELSWAYTELFNIAQWLDFSALDQLKDSNYVSTYTASSNYIINKQFSIGLSLGWQTTTNDSDGLLFGSTEVSYSW